MNKILTSIVCLTTLFATSTHAALAVSFQEIGSGVVMNASGTADLTALASEGIQPVDSFVDPTEGTFIVGSPSGSADAYSLLPVISFGLGMDSATVNSGSGDYIGIAEDWLIVPTGYISGSFITSTATFTGESFSSLGIDVGTYTWNWGSGPTADSLTLTVVPEPSTWAFLAGFVALSLVILRRRLGSK